MNNHRRLDIAQQHIKLLAIVDNLNRIAKDEKWAIEEIRNEYTKETAEQGLEKLDDLLDHIDSAIELFEDVAQGDYQKILDKEQKKQQQQAEQQRQQLLLERAKEQAQEEATTKREIDYFLKHVCPNPNNPEGYDIDSLDEFFEWKWQDTGQRNQYGDWVFEHTLAYKEYLKT